jgi:hypothetical protein
MRWDELFADLEGQLEAGIGAEERDREAEEERLRVGRLTIRDRIAAIAASTSPALVVQLVTGESIAIRARTFGRDWVACDLADSRDGAQAVLPLAAIAALLPAPGQIAASTAPVAPAGTLTDRLGVHFVLRDLCRRRRHVVVVTPRGSFAGTFDRVGRDHADLAVHAEGEWRRSSAVRQLRVIALSDVVLVRVH